jgi:hypothetical protein
MPVSIMLKFRIVNRPVRIIYRPQESPALFDCYLVTCSMNAVATHRLHNPGVAKRHAAAESNHDRSIRAFKIDASLHTTILPAVASSPGLGRVGQEHRHDGNRDAPSNRHDLIALRPRAAHSLDACRVA